MIGFYTMMIISIVAGLFSTMNIMVYTVSDIRFHLNDIYMVFLMTGWMLLFMTISEHRMNYIHLIISILFILVSFYNLREQVLIDDKEFIEGMIPHHSMAVLMADKIVDRTKNPYIYQLAMNILIPLYPSFPSFPFYKFISAVSYWIIPAVSYWIIPAVPHRFIFGIINLSVRYTQHTIIMRHKYYFSPITIEI
jgi:hypothetical protein